MTAVRVSTYVVLLTELTRDDVDDEVDSDLLAVLPDEKVLEYSSDTSAYNIFVTLQ